MNQIMIKKILNNYISQLEELERKIDIRFKNKLLLLEAITHRSYLNEHPTFPISNNERLEFLGDAVLEFVVSDHLFHNFSEREGILTAMRANIVNTKSLLRVGKKIDFKEIILTSKGEKKDIKSSIISNAVEALIGAIYLDQGLDVAKKFIFKNFLRNQDSQKLLKEIKDPKSAFQEKVQAEIGMTPTYKVLSMSGPDHRKEFKAGVFINNKLIAKGRGFSIKEAEEESAKKALKKSEKNNFKYH